MYKNDFGGKNMGHGHHHHSGNSEKNIGIAFLLNFSFVIIEVIGAVLTNSMAILSDALHDFGDSVSLGLAYIFEKKSKKNSNKIFTYGYKRLSLISALINSILLALGSIYILGEVIPRIWKPEVVEVNGMLWLAIVGIGVNGTAVFKLKGGNKIAEKAVALHLLEDLLGWIAVLIGAVIIKFTGWYIIDPLLSIGIAIYVIKNVFINLKSIWFVILQGIPEDFEIDILVEEIKALSLEILDIHDVHLWTLDGSNNVMTFHLVLADDCGINRMVELKREIKHYLEHKGIDEVNIDIENIGNCSDVFEHNHNSKGHK